MKRIVPILGLWLIAFIATVLIVGDSGKVTYLAPLFAVCMIGSVVTVRNC